MPQPLLVSCGTIWCGTHDLEPDTGRTPKATDFHRAEPQQGITAGSTGKRGSSDIVGDERTPVHRSRDGREFPGPEKKMTESLEDMAIHREAEAHRQAHIQSLAFRSCNLSRSQLDPPVRRLLCQT